MAYAKAQPCWAVRDHDIAFGFARFFDERLRTGRQRDRVCEVRGFNNDDVGRRVRRPQRRANPGISFGSEREKSDPIARPDPPLPILRFPEPMRCDAWSRGSRCNSRGSGAEIPAQSLRNHDPHIAPLLAAIAKMFHPTHPLSISSGEMAGHKYLIINISWQGPSLRQLLRKRGELRSRKSQYRRV